MSQTESWVTEAVAKLKLDEHVRLVDEPQRSQVLHGITKAFLKAAHGLFWWEHLKGPFSSWQIEEGYKRLPQLAPNPSADCWLVTGLEDERKGVFRCTAALATAVIGECPAFEYAVAGDLFDWMVIENHHDVIIAVGGAIAQLDKVRSSFASQ